MIPTSLILAVWWFVSSDYDGLVQVWDVHTNTELVRFEEHKRRVWSVDFSRMDPMRLAR